MSIEDIIAVVIIFWLLALATYTIVSIMRGLRRDS